MEYVALGIIVVIGIGLFIYGTRIKKMDAVINYSLRITGGMLAIYLFNSLLQYLSLNISVGMNAYNVLTIGILGIPGLLLLYGVSTYFILMY